MISSHSFLTSELFYLFLASASTSICGWQMVRSSIGPLDTTATQWTSLGYAINADHCGMSFILL